MRIWLSAKADYAVRAASALAASSQPGHVKAARIAVDEDIPVRFLLTILRELCRAGIVQSHRGSDGGFRLARPAREITVADVLRAVHAGEPVADGPSDTRDGGATVDRSPSALDVVVAQVRFDVWSRLERLTLAHLAAPATAAAPPVEANGAQRRWTTSPKETVVTPLAVSRTSAPSAATSTAAPSTTEPSVVRARTRRPSVAHSAR